MKAFLLTLAVVSSCAAAEEAGFVPMFNGRDLSGWVNANCAPETWTFTNGMIHCTGHPTGAMRTEKQYENFILEAEWRHLSSGGNSGIFIWGTPIAAPGVPFLRGIEVQVLDHGFNVKGKNEWYTTHGDVFPIHGAHMKPFGRHNGDRSFPSEERSKPSPEWNHYRIVCTNGVIRLSVNGKEVSGGEECNYRKGYLALESEGAPVEFRNVRIKELPASGAAREVTAPVDTGFRAIFNGLDLRGWSGSNRWAAEGERLQLKKGDASERSLRTAKDYGDAEFILDVKPKEPNAMAIVIVRGVPVQLRDAAPGNYTRFQVGVKAGEIWVKRGDNDVSRQAPAKSIPARAPFEIRETGGAIEFMNLYARDL